MTRPWRKLHLVSALAALLLVALTLHAFLRDRTLRNSLSYATRPLWDHADTTFPNAKLPFYHTYGLSTNDSQACNRQGWNTRTQQPPVVDAVIFSTELDLLHLRFAELDPVVDTFVVVESDFTFTGKPKPLRFHDNATLFEPWRHKIRYHHVPGRELAKGENPFAIEAEQRRAVTTILEGMKLAEGTLVLMSDVDEMPSAAAVSLLKTCEAPLPLHLSLTEYVYSFEFVTGTTSWRASAHSWRTGSTFYGHGKASERILLDAGWHCSWCFPSYADFQFKMQSYSHSDRLFGNRHWARLLDPAVIAEKVCKGEDVFDMLPEAYTWSELLARWHGERRTESVANLPAPLLSQQRRFAYLLPGGCRQRTP